MKNKIIALLFVLLLLTGCTSNAKKEEIKELSSIKTDLFFVQTTDYEEELSNIISELKTIEPSINISSYRMVFRIMDDSTNNEKKELISLYYYINNKVRTNKVYTITLINYEIDEIVSLKGILDENKDNINNVNLDLINKKISDFESNKINIIYEKVPYLYTNGPKLNADKSLAKEELSNDIKDFTEYYYYDYNTQKLSYKIEITKINSIMPNVEYEVDEEIEL